MLGYNKCILRNLLIINQSNDMDLSNFELKML